MVEIENLIDGKRYRIHGLLSSSVTMAKLLIYLFLSSNKSISAWIFLRLSSPIISLKQHYTFS